MMGIEEGFSTYLNKEIKKLYVQLEESKKMVN